MLTLQTAEKIKSHAGPLERPWPADVFIHLGNSAADKLARAAARSAARPDHCEFRAAQTKVEAVLIGAAAVLVSCPSNLELCGPVALLGKVRPPRPSLPRHAWRWCTQGCWQCVICLHTKRTPAAAVDNKTCAAHAWPTLCHGHKLWVTHGMESKVPLLFCAAFGRYSSTRMQHLSRPCAGAAVSQAARAVIKRIFATPSLHPVTGELLEDSWPVDPPADPGPFAHTGAGLTPGAIEDVFSAAAPSRRSRGAPPFPHHTGPSGQAASTSWRAGVGAALVGEVWPPDPSCQVLVTLPVEPPPPLLSPPLLSQLAGSSDRSASFVPPATAIVCSTPSCSPRPTTGSTPRGRRAHQPSRGCRGAVRTPISAARVGARR